MAFNEIIDAIFEGDNVLENFGKTLGDLLYDFFGSFPDANGVWDYRHWGITPKAAVGREQGSYIMSSPLVMDLDGDGVETTNVNDRWVMFDLDGDGVKNRTGWANADDGLLVFDRNRDGVINNGREMFGNYTAKYDGSSNCADGFEALAQEDTNGDGVVNQLDDNWQNLRIWRDMNQNGRTDDGELFTLEELGVAGLNVAHGNSAISNNGNTLRGDGTYIKVDGSFGDLTDAWFQQDSFYTEHGDPYEVPEEFRFLPQIMGAGNVASLQQASAKRDSLAEVVEDFTNSRSRAEQYDMMDELLYEWARTSGMAPFLNVRVAQYAPQYELIEKASAKGRMIDEYKLHVLEAFNGRYLVNFPFTTYGVFGDSNVEPMSREENTLRLALEWSDAFIDAIDNAYAALKESVFNALVVQSVRLEPLFDLIDLSLDLGNLTVGYDFSRLEQYFSDKMSADPVNGLSDLIDFTRANEEMLSKMGWNGFDLAYDTMRHWEATPELRSLYEALRFDSRSVISYNYYALNNNGLFLGTDANDAITGGIAHDVLGGGRGDDTLKGGTGNDVLYGDVGNDSLTGDAGDDTLHGGAGDDTLDGGSGDDVLDGGAGDDTLTGSGGNDVFVFGKGYGNDTVNSLEGSGYKKDSVRLVGLTADEVEFNVVSRVSGSSTYYDLVIRIKATGETLTIQNGMNSDYRYQIQSVEFGDGTVWSYADILTNGLNATDANETLTLYQSGILHGLGGDDTINGSSYADQLFGGAGDDTLDGGSGDDVLDGGAGDDTLTGSGGNDVFVFGKGYGNDTVNSLEGSGYKKDSVRLVGLTADEVEFNVVSRVSGSSTYYDLVIRIKATGETLTIQNGMNSDYRYQIQSVEFGDGTVWSHADIVSSGLYATNEGETLTLYQSGILHGLGGDDVLNGSNYADQLYGGEGDDTLNGGTGDDILDGGAGNDMLTGGSGNDTYIFGSGNGQDSINNYGGGNDLLSFADVNPADLWFGRSGSHLLIGLVGTSDQVTVNNWYDAAECMIDRIETGDSYLVESQVAQLVQAMAAVGAPGGAGGQWTDEQRDALAPVLASYWQPRV